MNKKSFFKSLKQIGKKVYEYSKNIISKNRQKVSNIDTINEINNDNNDNKLIDKNKENTIREIDNETGDILSIDVDTGEVVDIKKGTKSKQKRVEKQKENNKQNYNSEYFKSSGIIAGFKMELNNIPPRIASKINDLLYKVELEIGTEELAFALEQQTESILEICIRLAYDSGAVLQELSTSLLNYLPNASEQWKKDTMEEWEMYSNWD